MSNKYNSESPDDKRYRLMMEKKLQARDDAGPIANAPHLEDPEGAQRLKDFKASRIQTRSEREVEGSMPQAQPLNMGGMPKYEEATERDSFFIGSLAKGAGKLGKKVLDEAKKHVDDLKTEATPNQKSIAAATKGQRATRDSVRKSAAVSSAATAVIVGGPDASEWTYAELDKDEKSEFEKAFSEARSAGEDVFEFKGNMFTTELREEKMEGGKIKYAEGSMLMPPEMEDQMPVDTYDNIPEEEMAAVEDSQLPDAEMEEDYTGYVLEQSLDMEEQQYLMSVLETDERLGGIFDKVMDVAGEFAGNGAVEGLGDGTSDSIPARLSDGEFVFTKKATDQMGADQLQTMMDDAERAYDGGLMKKAFGGLTSEDDIGMDSYDSEEEVKKQMISANQMPSIR